MSDMITKFSTKRVLGISSVFVPAILTGYGDVTYFCASIRVYETPESKSNGSCGIGSRPMSIQSNHTHTVLVKQISLSFSVLNSKNEDVFSEL